MTQASQTNNAKQGDPYRYLRGHHVRKKVPDDKATVVTQMTQRWADGQCPWDGTDCVVGIGYCHCGCGEKPALVERNNYKYLHLRGLPFRFRTGHHCRILTEKEVQEIRFLYATTDITQTQLAEKFNVSQVTISKIALFDRWRNAGVGKEGT